MEAGARYIVLVAPLLGKWHCGRQKRQQHGDDEAGHAPDTMLAEVIEMDIARDTTTYPRFLMEDRWIAERFKGGLDDLIDLCRVW